MTNKSIKLLILLSFIFFIFPAICFSEAVTKSPSWDDEINNVLSKKNGKINIGLIIDIKINELDEYKRDQLENDEENQFFVMIEKNKGKYKVTGRKHLLKVLEEQGITSSETVRLGKAINLDVIVYREIYEASKMTKVLKVDTGEVLLFKTYKK